MAGMTCTQCFCETGTEPDLSSFPVKVRIEMCENWLCDTCLNDLEREIIASPLSSQALSPKSS